MKKTEINLLATCKTVDTFGDQNQADFPATETGGQQFAIIKTAVTATAGLGTDQVTGDEAEHGGALDEAALRLKLHTDLVTISTAVHSLVLLGTPGLEGQFHLPRHDGDQDLLNTARAFAVDAEPIQAALIGLKLPATFLADLNQDISDFETAFKAKGSGTGKKSGATTGIAQTIHAAGIALHVLNTVVPNTYADNPQKRAEWIIASHVTRHTPVSKPATLAKKAAQAAAKTAAKAAKNKPA